MPITAPPLSINPALTIAIQVPVRGRIDIEYQYIAAADPQAPLMVFLHEGLGSVAMWKDWPAQFCRQAGVRGLVYSRYGYGRSTPRPHAERWAPDYILEQARDDLPALLAALGLDDTPPLLFGHSDGGSIALLYAALYPKHVRGIAIAAPHIFVEDRTLDAIVQAREAYQSTSLREKLARYHQDPDSAFWGWNDAWLNPPFRHWDIRNQLPAIRCPVLAIQGDHDEYASLDQIMQIPDIVPQTICCVLPDCGHSPHTEQTAQLNDALIDWLRRL
ncbi:alpha/beta hydrolase [Alcaligenaceae bacterium CGII-47]|nr:alpha/beta hydrolase [Alcaligenaceae bacterium CGII-47]